MRLGIVEPDEGVVSFGDRRLRVRFAALLVDARSDLGDAARAIDEGVVSFGDLETLFPNPAATTALETLMTIRLAAGPALRRDDDPIRTNDETAIRHIVSMSKALGGIEHAPTVARMFGDRAERVASAAPSLYREHVDRPWLETGKRLDPALSRRGSQAGRRLLDQTE